MFNAILSIFGLMTIKQAEFKHSDLHEELRLEKLKNSYKAIPEEKVNTESSVVKNKKETELTIVFTDNTKISWKNNVELNEFNWKKFYKWYFSKITPLFVFHHEDGETIVKRDFIKIVLVKNTILKGE